MSSDWDKRKAVQRMQEYIEDHLQTPITMRDLSQAARYSMYYAARIFKEITGRSPYEYIRLRRLSAAALQLSDGKARIIDVAFDFVFDSHEDKEYMQAIHSIWDVMNSYKPEIIGYEWADNDAPRFQLNPMGYRGYIEGRPVRRING